MAKLTTRAKTPAGQNPVYMGPDKGPFKCENCEHYVESKKCIKPEMVKIQDRASFALVHEDGCCNYYEPNL